MVFALILYFHIFTLYYLESEICEIFTLHLEESRPLLNIFKIIHDPSYCDPTVISFIKFEISKFDFLCGGWSRNHNK